MSVAQKAFVIEYGTRDGETGEVCDLMQWRTRAYDAEHAIEKFYDHGDDDGFVPVRVAYIEGREARSHEWQWEEVGHG